MKVTSLASRRYKSCAIVNWSPAARHLVFRCGRGWLFAILLAGLSVSAARADLIYVTNAGNGTIGEYTTAGAAVNAALLTGLSSPYGIAVSGTNLSIATHLGGTVDKYDATTQKLLASISGLNSPAGVAVSSSRLFVAEQGAGKIDEYAATTLKLVKAGRVTGLG